MNFSYEYVDKQADIPAIIREAEKQIQLSLDTETTGLDMLNSNTKLLLLQIEVGGKAYVIDARKVNIEPFRGILENKRCIKIVQNANFDYKVIYLKRNIAIQGIFDTKIAEALIQAGLNIRKNSLIELAKTYTGIKLDKSITLSFVDFPDDAEFSEEQIKYAAFDVLVLPEIKRAQQLSLKTYGMSAIAELEFALVEPVAQMEIAGIILDAERWRKSLEITKRKLFKLSTDLRQVLPDPPVPPPKPTRLKKDGTPYKNTAKLKPLPILNLNSWQQVAWSCKEIGIDLVEANRKTGKGLTNNGTLKVALSICGDDAIKTKVLRDFIAYRGFKQIEKTFGENLIDHIRKEDGRIHAEFHQNGTDSGRFSSSKPNLQNIQKKGEEGRILRSCFIPKVGNKFIIADYSQIELRIAAEKSEDPVMLRILNDPRGDIHKGTASEMYGIPYDQVSKDLRNAAKTLNFGIIYGMQIRTLSERLGCSPIEAAQHLQTYNNTYHVLMEWLDNQANEAFEKGRTVTIGGRIRWFPSLDPKHKDYRKLKAFYERVGRNHPIQGTSADMTKTSMVLLYNPLKELCAYIVNSIHDELCTEVPLGNTIIAAQLIKRKMIFAGEKYLRKVPVLVDIKIRDCWWKDDGVDDNELGQQLWLLPWQRDENGYI
jgi:DNA polymerase I